MTLEVAWFAQMRLEIVDPHLLTELRRKERKATAEDGRKGNRGLFEEPESLGFKLEDMQKIADEVLRIGQGYGVLGQFASRWNDDDGSNIADKAAARRRGSEAQCFLSIMEFRWRPEGRLIENDCSCELWDEIKYEY